MRQVGLSVVRVTPYQEKLLAAFMDEVLADEHTSRQFTWFKGRTAMQIIYDKHVFGWLWEDYGRPVAWGHIELSPNAHKIGVGRLGVCVAPDQHGKGLGTRVVGWLLEKAKEGGLHKVVATVYADNAPMVHIYKDKYGFVEEGRFRHEEIWEGVWRDVLSLAKFLDAG